MGLGVQVVLVRVHQAPGKADNTSEAEGKDVERRPRRGGETNVLDMTRSTVADAEVAEARDELRPLGQDPGTEVMECEAKDAKEEVDERDRARAERGWTHARGSCASEQRKRQDWNAEGELYAPVVRYGMAEHVGGRARMEDMILAVEELEPTHNCSTSTSPRAFFGVFDGHGGSDAAKYVHTYLLPNILDDVGFPASLHDVYRRAFWKTDVDFSRECSLGKLAHSGTTATTALVWGKRLSVANLGDCRAVLCQRGKAMELTGDQKPTTTHEKQRILAAGGFVDGEGFLNGLLGVSRAFGDWHYEELKLAGPKTGPLSSVPEVTEWELTREDEFLVIACDGLWDVFSSQNAIEFARGELRIHNDPAKCSEALVQEALRRNTCDNVSAIVICFSTLPPPRRQYGGFGLNRSISTDAFSSLQDALNLSMEHNTNADRILL